MKLEPAGPASTTDSPFSARRSVMKNHLQILMKNGGGFELTTLMTRDEIISEVKAAKAEGRWASLQTIMQAGMSTADVDPSDIAAIVHAPTGSSVTITPNGQVS